jgi:hypothetical protein
MDMTHGLTALDRDYDMAWDMHAYDTWHMTREYEHDT